MEKRFHVFVRHHAAGVSVNVVTHPHLCAFGADLPAARRDLAIVLDKLLRRGELLEHESFFSDARLRRVDLTLRAFQRGRLLEVPMRFSVLTYTRSSAGTVAPGLPARARRKGPLRVMVPRLELEGEVNDASDLPLYVEELIRHELHLAEVGRLLRAAYSGEEALDVMVVPVSARHAAERATPRQPEDRPPSMPPALAEACRWLERERAAGTLGRAFQRTAEVSLLAGQLRSRTRASVLLVGPSSVGKTCLVHELVHRAAEKGSELAGLEIYSTSAGRIVAGMRYLGEWQERLGRMITELRGRAAVLHFESLSELLSVGTRGDTLDIARFLLPAVEAGDISLVVEATSDDLTRAERTHGPFVQALRAMTLAPVTPAAAREILTAVGARSGRDRQVRFAAEALDRALDLGERFGDGVLPGVAVELLHAAARAAPRRSTVDARALTAAFCARTGYPQGLVDPAIPLDPAEVAERLRTRVMGQDVATQLLTNLVVTLKTNLADPRKPLGSFLLLGPTGVGKTESALALAELLFGDERRLHRFDMAEYAAPGSAARLIDASVREGTLARRVREQPFGVVLLDEIEKADAGVHDLLLQVLGDGRLSDSAGAPVSFRNTVVLMTSNLGADSAGRSIGFGDAGEVGHDTHYRAAAAAFFRPELLNRFDQIVPYRPLGREIMKPLVQRVLQQALGREGLERRGIQVRFDDTLLQRLVELGFDSRLGARPLKRAVEQHVIVPLAHAVGALPQRRAQGVLVLSLVVRKSGDISVEPHQAR